MSKNDFKDTVDMSKERDGVKSGGVYEIAEKGRRRGKMQAAASLEEQTRRKNEMKTQGRKGCKAIRANMIFTPENHLFIKVMSNVLGMSMSQFTNYMIDNFKVDHPDVYDRAKEFIKFAEGMKQ